MVKYILVNISKQQPFPTVGEYIAIKGDNKRFLVKEILSITWKDKYKVTLKIKGCYEEC